MKSKLLKKLRRIGRGKITIHSVTRTDGCVTGMCYGYDEDEYQGLFELGDTKEDVQNKAARIYIQSYLKANQNK